MFIEKIKNNTEIKEIFIISFIALYSRLLVNYNTKPVIVNRKKLQKIIKSQMLRDFAKKRQIDLETGRQRNLTKIAQASGLPFTVFITSALWEGWVVPDHGSLKKGENEDMRISLIINKLIHSIRVHRRSNKSNILEFEVSLTKEEKSKQVSVISFLGPVSEEDKSPCLTLVLPEELDESFQTN